MKVSVAMITYNHERFIAQAVESVLMQETSFDYELVIGEDYSTDRTREIVVDLQRRFPERIRLLLRDENVGTHENFAQTLAACSGEYVALLEGDDYWTSPLKLQKQVDFLDDHADCSMSFHPVRWFVEGKGRSESQQSQDQLIWPERCGEYSTIEDVLREIFIQTGSVMFRRRMFAGYPAWLYDLRGADWSLFILLADQGRIGCISEVMGAYRKHPGGITHGADLETIYASDIKMYNRIDSHFASKYARIIRPILADRYQKLAVLYDQRGESNRARACVAQSIKLRLLGRQRPSLNCFKMLARLSLPSLYYLSKRVLKSGA